LLSGQPAEVEEKKTDMFAAIMIVLTFVLVLAFAVQPLFVSKGTAIASDKVKLETLEIQKLSLYEQIKELELEFDMGNVSSDDYQRNRIELKREVSMVLEQLNSISSE